MQWVKNKFLVCSDGANEAHVTIGNRKASFFEQIFFFC